MKCVVACRRALLVAALLVSQACAGLGAPSSSPSAQTFTLQREVRVALPSAAWAFEVEKDDPNAVSLVKHSESLSVLLRLGKNKSGMDSKHAAAALESRLMRAPNSAGRAFGLLKSRIVGGLPGTGFTIDDVVQEGIVARAQYVVVSYGTRYLVILTSGSVSALEKHRQELDRLIASIAFVGRR